MQPLPGPGRTCGFSAQAGNMMPEVVQICLYSATTMEIISLGRVMERNNTGSRLPSGNAPSSMDVSIAHL